MHPSATGQTTGTPRIRSERAGRDAVRAARLAASRAAPRTILHTSFRQSDAFEAADLAYLTGQQWRGKVFSHENASDGSRRFVFAPDVRKFWTIYRSVAPLHRHWYEIIRSDTPCHLYYDLEFKTDTSSPELSSVDGALASQHLLWITALRLHAVYGVDCRRSDVVVLESSTASKFSRHVVIRAPDGSRFRNALHAGAFARSIVHSLGALRGASSAFSAMWSEHGDALVEPRSSSPAFFADLSVYSRNRAMRMYLSCKFRKSARLLPASDNAFRDVSSGSCNLASDASGLERVEQLHDHWVPSCPCRSDCLRAALLLQQQLFADGVVNECRSGSATNVHSCPSRVVPTASHSETVSVDPAKGASSSVAAVQVGSLMWETQLWRGSLITDQIVPMWLDAAKRSLGAAGVASVDLREFLAEHRQRAENGAIDKPAVHPLGFRLLYFDTDREEPCARRLHAAPCVTLQHGGVPEDTCIAAGTGKSETATAGMKRARLPVGMPEEVLEPFELGSTTGRDPPFGPLVAWVLIELASGKRFCSARVDDDLRCPKEAKLRGWFARGFVLPRPQRVPADSAASPSSTSRSSDLPVRVTTNLRLDIAGSHWCQRIGRHHKSNHVTWHLSLVHHSAWQTCLDVDCRSLRYCSPHFSLPPELMPNQLPVGFSLAPVAYSDPTEVGAVHGTLSGCRPESDCSVSDAEVCAYLDEHEAELLAQVTTSVT